MALPLLLLSASATPVAGADERAGCEAAVLTLPEAAALLRIDVESMTRLAEGNSVPGRRIVSDWRFSCEALLDWLQGDMLASAVESRAAASASSELASVTDSPLTATELARITATGTQAEQAAGASTSEPPPSADGGRPIGEAPEERTAEEILLRTERVLLGPGQAVLDFGQFFYEFNSQPLATVDGNAVLTTVEQESFLTSLQARIGFRNEIEIFAGTTYIVSDSEAFLGSQKVASASASDFGSVNFGARHTLKREGPGRPDIIGTISARIPTDDGPHAVGGSLAFVKSVDPVVLFASIGYTHVFTDDPPNLMLLEPEDRFDIAFGYALGLNDTIALSMSIAGTFTAAERYESSVLRQQDAYSLRFGLTSWLARGVYIEPSVSFSLGGPEDGLTFGITVPYTLGR